uniref:Similar to viral A-type inclusion protein n=1 Tax=Haemonchus contortus TaxID=6289 RepID=W6NCI8_HAECO
MRGKTKTKKESDEEEMVREQRTKLAELMKGILNGRGTTETTAYLSRKARRQTWAPGNDLPFLNRRGSLSPPCKKERALGSIEECGGQASDEKIQSTGMDTGEKASSVFLIPNFIPSGRRSITKTDIEVQTLEPYPEDRSDEVATLKKGNAYLVEQLSTKTKHCKELEEQREEFANEFKSLKAALGRMQDVETGALILEKQLEDMKRENAKFSEEVVALRKENASLKTCMMENESNPADRTQLIHRIDELHEELCETRKSASQAKASTMKDADSLALEREREIESLKEALATARKEIEAAVNAQENIKRQFEEQYLAAMAASEEELQQLRKDNADLRARINALLVRVHLR